jgi:hypothetical protein
MRKAILLCAIPFICGCNLFRKIETNSRLTASAESHGVQTNIKEVDTGNIQTKEHWTFRIPFVVAGDQKSFIPKIPDSENSNNSEDSKDSENSGGDTSLVKSIANVQNLSKGSLGTIAYLEAQLTRFINNQKGTSKETKSKDTSTKTNTASDLKVTKDPVIPWWGMLVVMALMSIVISWIFKRFS